MPEIKNHEKHINLSFKVSQELRQYLRPFVEQIIKEQPGISSKNTVKEVIKRSGRGSNNTVAGLYISVLRARHTAHRLKDRCYIDGAACERQATGCPNGYNPLGCEEYKHTRARAHKHAIFYKNQLTLVEEI